MPRLRIALAALLLGACARPPVESFPPLVRSGTYMNVSSGALWGAVREHAELAALPVRRGSGVGRVLETEWMPLDPSTEGLSERMQCSVELEATPETRLRYRSRFTVLTRGDRSLLRLEAHWQVAVRSSTSGDVWRTCPSTGRWERSLEERLELRARNMF